MFVIFKANAFYYDLFNSLREHVISISIQMMSDEFEDFTHHQQVALDLRIKNATYSEGKNFYYEPLSSSTSKNNSKNNNNNIISQKK